MLKKLVTLFFIGVFITSLSFKTANAEAHFQADKFPYEQMQIQVMPEFDYPADWPENTPSLLVGQYGTFTNKSGQDFNGKIQIPLPVKEKNFEVNFVAEFPDENKPEVERPYDIDIQNGVISWTPRSPIKKNAAYRYVIEYYTNPIAGKSAKNFTYQFTNQANITTLDVIYYAPMNAKNIQLQPSAQDTAKSNYGENLYYYQYKNVKPGNTFKYSFSYVKSGNTSSLSVIQKVQPPNDSNHAGVQGSKTTSKTENGKQPIIGIGGAAIIGISLMIAGLFVFFGLKGRSLKNKSIKNQHGSTQGKKESKLANSEEKKELRKKLLNGKIDKETYEEEMKKLI